MSESLVECIAVASDHVTQLLSALNVKVKKFDGTPTGTKVI